MVTTERNNTIERDLSSPEFINEFLKTIPVRPYSASILYTPNGVDLSDNYSNLYRNNREEYFGICKENRIIPYSRLIFRFDPRSKRFTASDFKGGMDELILEGRDTYNHLVLEGGRINNIAVKIENENEESFDIFRNTLLESLKSMDYQPKVGDLHVATDTNYRRWTDLSGWVLTPGIHIQFATPGNMRNINADCMYGEMNKPGIKIKYMQYFDKRREFIDSWIKYLTQTFEG